MINKRSTTPAAPPRFNSCRYVVAPLLVLGLILGLSGPPLGAGPADLHFSRLDTEDGLSQGSVWTIVQDNRGFLWFGTEDGLDRFDGDRVMAFGGQGGGLEGRFVRGILELDDALWIATDGGGLSRFDPYRESFETWRHVAGDPTSLAEDLVVALALDINDRLWLAFRNRGLQRLAADGRSFEIWTPSDAPGCAALAGDLHTLLADRAGRMWIGTAEGLYCCDLGTSCLRRVGAGEGAESLSDQRLTHLREDPTGDLWVASRGGLDRLDPDTGRIERRLLAGGSVTTTLETRDGTLWAGLAGGGLVSFTPGAWRPRLHTHRPLDEHSLGSDTVRVLFEDRSGVLWIGTEQGGASHIPSSRWQLGARRTVVVNGETARLRGVMALHFDGARRLWAGTRDQGLFVLGQPDIDGKGKDAWHLGLADGWPDALGSSRISALAAGDGEEMLVATAEGELYAVAPDVTEVHRLPPFTDRSLRALLKGADSDLWVGTWGAGLFHLDMDGTVIEEWTTRGDSGRVLSDDIVLCLTQTEDGVLWAGTWIGGLQRIDPDSGRVDIFRHLPNVAGSLSSDRVASLLPTSRAELWIATDRGLDHLDLISRKIRRIPELADQTLLGLRGDKTGHLWISGHQGLWHYDPQSGKTEHFLARHGLHGNEFNVGAAADRDGELAFGGVDGLNRFRPHARAGSDFPGFGPQLPKPLALARVSTPRRTLSAAQLAALVESGKPLMLDREERHLSFVAAWLDFSDTQPRRFSYRLEGRDEEWIDLGRQRDGSLHDLAPGHYTLRLGARAEPSTSVDEEVALALVVAPAFGERLGVRAALAGLALGVVVLSVGAWHRRRWRRVLLASEEAIETRQRLLSAKEQERVRLAQDLHDGPLQRIHALQLVAGDSKALRSTDLYSDLAAVVSEIRDICTRLRSPVLELFGLEAAIRDLAATLRKDHPEIKISLDPGGANNHSFMAPSGGADPLPPEVARVLYRVCQEALGNAVRHGAPSEIRVILRGSAAGATLEVADDGRGFALPVRWIDLARRGHLGVLGMMERTESIGGTLQIESTAGRGTRIRARVPWVARGPGNTEQEDRL